MLEKLIQAAIITFLLHLIAGLSPNTLMQTKTASPMQQPMQQEMPPNIVSLLLRPFQ
ncbi:hypothetical protein [Nostoc sp. 'Lobaria pulmonaria (5183) cyanobiont']|uniref:hypothetical protein n=1 Tax=Nostoc sp. 'Lobaria pulmonaria (5183) cyanobiont' TaxID=1618022 RepID=UPI000D0C5122|nr:hypothetical protein [Nostoc sp. 'Lobaria pulmonaria (5183) cyanobiont']AVH72998.1 hypothetical protein NLP_4600 [Nostoc sp. 'Lobaria pulmonaria (5183) cyanobiont']